MPQLIEITDFSDPALDIYARMNETQLLHFREPDLGIFIAESPKVIERALRAGFKPISFLVAKEDFAKDASPFFDRYPDVPFYTADLEILTHLTGFQLTRGLLCAMERLPLPSLESLCEGTSRIAILQQINNPTNVGAIFRSAAALNIDAVVLTKGCSNPLYRRAARVSMGTVFQIPWTILPEEVLTSDCQSMTALRSLGFKTAAMALTDISVSIDDEALMQEERLAIFLGNEGEGLGDETIAACDYTVMIPMSHGVDSLNVAAASAVAFWQLGNRNSKNKS